MKEVFDGKQGKRQGNSGEAAIVGWVERSDTQQLQTMGIALLNPSYAGYAMQDIHEYIIGKAAGKAAKHPKPASIAKSKPRTKSKAR